MADSTTGPIVLPAGVSVLERGWLSANNIVLADGDDVTVVDSGYVTHAEQTVALVRQALAGRRLTRLINTHSHSDHIGGNAALVAAFGCAVTVPAGMASAVSNWDADALMLRPTGQQGEPFPVHATLADGDTFVAGGVEWRCHAAPGHDMDALVFHAPAARLLVSGDALWEDGFGVLFADLLEAGVGARAAAQTLDLIGRLPVDVVIPGHGAPFGRIDEALVRAQRRLAAFTADSARHARHAVKVLITFRMLEDRRMERAEFVRLFSGLSLMQGIAERFFNEAPEQLVERSLGELLGSGVLVETEGHIIARG